MRHRIIALAITVALLPMLAFAAPALWASALPANQPAGGYFFEGRLDAANTITADEQTTAVTGFAAADLIAFEINCTEDSGTATLDVALQRSIDGGTVWTTIIAMTQLAATGSEVKVYSDLQAAAAQIIGDRLRINYDVTGAGQYTCSSYITAES